MNDSMYEGTKYLVSHDYDYDATTTDDVSFDSIYLICTAELLTCATVARSGQPEMPTRNGTSSL